MNNESDEDCLSDPNDNEYEPSDEDTDKLSNESGFNDVCSCDETKFELIHSHTIPEEYRK